MADLSPEAKEPSTLVRERTTEPEIVQPNVEKVTETTSETSEPTPGELVALGRPPYATDLLEARMAYETFDVKEQINEIDAYIREQSDDTRVGYETIFNGIKAHIQETDDIYTTLKQMVEYVQLEQKVNGVIQEKKDFEAKDPGDMSGEELKRLLKSKGIK